VVGSSSQQKRTAVELLRALQPTTFLRMATWHEAVDGARGWWLWQRLARWCRVVQSGGEQSTSRDEMRNGEGKGLLRFINDHCRGDKGDGVRRTWGSDGKVAANRHQVTQSEGWSDSDK
jgi:hypothetical protein